MAVATLEDLQGTIEVVVFPRLYETSRPDVARRRDPARRRPGRPQGRGDLVLADLVVDWDDARRPRPRGVRPRGRGRRPRWPGRGRRGTVAAGTGRGPAHGGRGTGAPRPMVAVGPGVPVDAGVPAGVPVAAGQATPATSRSSRPCGPAPRRRTHRCRRSPRPSRCRPTRSRPARSRPTPRRPRNRRSPTRHGPARRTWRSRRPPPLDAGTGHVLHVRFLGSSADRLFEAMRAVPRGRPRAARRDARARAPRRRRRQRSPDGAAPGRLRRGAPRRDPAAARGRDRRASAGLMATPASWIATRPTADVDAAAGALERWWGIRAECTELRGRARPELPRPTTGRRDTDGPQDREPRRGPVVPRSARAPRWRASRRRTCRSPGSCRRRDGRELVEPR